jgi:hypothetical protein
MKSFNSLQAYLNKTTKKTIIMTHFPPFRSGTSAPKYLIHNSKTNLYFSWPEDTLDRLKLTNIPLWISGHTHWSYDLKKYNIRFISNQLGYKSETNLTGLNEEGLYEIEIIS